MKEIIQSNEKQRYLDARVNIFDIDELVYEKKESIDAIKSELSSPGPTHNLCVFGMPGSGKSTLVTREINRVAGKEHIAIYINCKDHDNANDIYNIINFEFKKNDPGFFDDLNTQVLQKKQKHMKGYELMKHFIINSKRKIFVVLDEIENILQKRDRASQNFSYRMIRGISEGVRHVNYNYTVVFMTNKMDIKRELANDVRGSTNPVIVLPMYDAPDIYNILKKRTDYCLIENTIEDDALLTISKIAKQDHDSDARQAIILLSQCIRIAQQGSMDAITIETVYKAHDKVKKDELDKELASLDQQRRIFLMAILLKIEQQLGITEFTLHDVAEMYDAYCDQHQITDKVGWKQLSNYLASFITCGLVSIKDPSSKNKTYIFKENTTEIKSRISKHLPGDKVFINENELDM